MNTLLLSLIGIMLTNNAADNEIPLTSDTTIVFASQDEGTGILTARDDFVQRMSPFDRAARIQTAHPVSEAEYLEFVGSHVRRWDEVDKQKVTTALGALRTRLSTYNLPLPKKVYMICTSGAEEGGAAYTRANAVILPKGMLRLPAERIQKTICHELFHVMSRTNSELRDALYASIGFVKCNEVPFPSNLAARKITNPDAPMNDHCIHLQIGDRKQWVVPILFSRLEQYDEKRGGPFFRYLELKMLVVDRNEDTSIVQAPKVADDSQLVDLRQVTGFYEQVGRNTSYIIHPEEILADNFALLILGNRRIPSPLIVERMDTILKSTPAPPDSERPSSESR